MSKVKVILLLLLLLLLGGCKSQHAIAYDESLYQDFIDQIALALRDEISPSVFVDLRSYGNLEDPNNSGYVNGHIEYFINYDYSLMGDEEFIKVINYRFPKKTHLFIIDEDGQVVERVAQLLIENGYRHLYYYTNGYQSLIELAQDQLPLSIGNCNC